ncbi:SPOSA6832_03730, partial [Sporobolomyces salmonicolor]
MPFGQLVIGPPGSGKTTYCWGIYQFFRALRRPILLINLDPASASPPYPHSLSISSLISLQDAMDAHSLGPNGAMLYCLEYLEANLDWLEAELDKAMQEVMEEGELEMEEGVEELQGEGDRHGTRKWKREEMYVVFDTPGQVELSTDHGSLKRVVEFLQKKLGFRLAAIHLTDASHILDASKYVAVLLLALRTMLQLELPHVNVLSKIDLLGQAVQDLSYLLPLLERDPRTRRFSELNRTICELVEEFGLVGFETLAVEVFPRAQDKASMLALVQTIDQALGYVPPTLLPSTSSSDPHRHSVSPHSHSHAHSSLPVPSLSSALRTSDVQEKWVDNADEYR